MPQRDGRTLWETLMLEGFQAGLAWITVLRKRVDDPGLGCFRRGRMP